MRVGRSLHSGFRLFGGLDRPVGKSLVRVFGEGDRLFLGNLFRNGRDRFLVHRLMLELSRLYRARLGLFDNG
jgi:hypothetical protein